MRDQLFFYIHRLLLDLVISEITQTSPGQFFIAKVVQVCNNKTNFYVMIQDELSILIINISRFIAKLIVVSHCFNPPIHNYK